MKRLILSVMPILLSLNILSCGSQVNPTSTNEPTQKVVVYDEFGISNITNSTDEIIQQYADNSDYVIYTKTSSSTNTGVMGNSFMHILETGTYSDGYPPKQYEYIKHSFTLSFNNQPDIYSYPNIEKIDYEKDYPKSVYTDTAYYYGIYEFMKEAGNDVLKITFFERSWSDGGHWSYTILGSDFENRTPIEEVKYKFLVSDNYLCLTEID